MKTLGKKIIFMFVAVLAVSGAFAFVELEDAEAKKDGIKSSTTGNCWDTGKQCKKD